MKVLGLLLTLFLNVGFLFAEDIKGTIIDTESGEPIEYVSIAVYNSDDNSLITGVISSIGGKFEINNVKAGSYYLEVSFIGYDKQVIQNITVSGKNSEVDLGVIKLNQAVTQLAEVEVVADELAVEYKIDRKIIRADQQLAAASGTAVDILQNLPSITVDVDGTVALRGSTGFMVLIDGRPTVLEASEALRSIPSNTIDNIEVITNPSAKYNPDGTAGIINIITKKNKLEGFSGTGNLNLGNFGRYGGGLLANYTNSKWTVYLGGDINTNPRPRFEYGERVTFSNDTSFFVRSEGLDDSRRDVKILRGGAGYNFTKNDFLNIEFTVGDSRRESETKLDFDEGILPGNIQNEYISEQISTRGGDFYSINGTYQHDFDENHNLVAQVQYRNRNGEERTINQLTDLDGNITNGQINTEVGPGSVLQTNLDYVLPIGNLNFIEAGYQSRFGRSEDVTELFYYNVDTEEFEIQPEFSNDITYLRDIHALYGIFKGEKGRFGYQAGLRGEYTNRNISSSVSDDQATLERYDFFPSVYASYKGNGEQQFIASYSRRIERPRSWYMEPFITWSDAFNVRQGNPEILPEYINAFELSYLKGLGSHSFSIDGYYRTTINKVERVRSVYQENVILTRPENVGQDYAFGGELALSLNFFKWWSIDFSGNFYNYILRGSLDDVSFDQQSFNWNTRLMNVFKFFEGNRIQINGRYNSRTVTAQGSNGDYWTADIAVSQDFWGKRMTGVLQVRDMFGPVVRDSESSGTDFFSYNERYNRAPQVSFTLNYRFNNYKSNRRGRGDDGDEF